MIASTSLNPTGGVLEDSEKLDHRGASCYASVPIGQWSRHMLGSTGADLCILKDGKYGHFRAL